MINFLAWVGFVASLLVQIGSFIESAPLGAAVMVLHLPCLLLYLLASSQAGIRTRKVTRADCAGAAADLLFFFEPYAFAVFAWGVFATHDKSLSLFVMLRMFSAVWMVFFLMSAGLMARGIGWASRRPGGL